MSQKTLSKPRSTTCLYLGKPISADEAVAIRDTWTPEAGEPLNFFCTECGRHVRPRWGKGPNIAHFAHIGRNADCQLSSIRYGSEIKTPEFVFLEESDTRAIEGYLSDRVVTQHMRNQAVVEQRKREDGYRCVACGFCLKVEDRFIIECHHIERVADSGVRQVSSADLVSLCPTCHRIAHTRVPPYSVEEIASLRGEA